MRNLFLLFRLHIKLICQKLAAAREIFSEPRVLPNLKLHLDPAGVDPEGPEIVQIVFVGDEESLQASTSPFEILGAAWAYRGRWNSGYRNTLIVILELQLRFLHWKIHFLFGQNELAEQVLLFPFFLSRNFFEGQLELLPQGLENHFFFMETRLEILQELFGLLIILRLPPLHLIGALTFQPFDLLLELTILDRCADSLF